MPEERPLEPSFDGNHHPALRTFDDRSRRKVADGVFQHVFFHITPQLELWRHHKGDFNNGAIEQWRAGDSAKGSAERVSCRMWKAPLNITSP
jgi:hypothetical protein